MAEPTTDRLRYDITRGRSGDKVDFPDPAAAPLGTDDEAAGTPPAPREVRKAYDQEIRSGVSSEAKSDHAVAIYFTAVVGLITIVGLAIWLL